MPRNGFFSLSGTRSQSISRRMKSVVSFALIGPPKMMAPVWAAMVSGSGSAKRGRRTSSAYPRWRKACPMRPGVEVSWCSTIRIGRSIVRSLRSFGIDLNTRSSRFFKINGAPPPCRRAFPGGRRLRAAPLLASHEREDESARGQADHRRHRAIGDARNDQAAALRQAAIAISRHLLGGTREKSRKGLVAHAGAGLKLGRHRAGAKHGNPHAFRPELAMQR